MSHQDNVSRIKVVREALADLRNDVVFVGGSTVSFYADRESFEVRETDDVDVIIEVLTYPDHVKFEEKIQALGFSPDTTARVKVRYKIKGIIVDFMPTTDVAIGFENKWYPDGYKNAIEYSIDNNETIKILSPEHFIATKLEAFKNRGYSDPRQSHDFEDIVYMLENRNAIWSELANCAEPVKNYLKQEFGKLLSQKGIEEWIDCHVDFVSPPSTYMIIEELKKFASLMN
jgi:predicted nucleotidyltransferase